MKFFTHSLLAVALVVASITVPAAVATAAGVPDVQLTSEVSASTLYGSDVSVTLSVQQSSVPAINAYNLTFTDILPVGATLTDSTYPVSEQILLSDGTTKVIWSNVADLSAGIVLPLTYSFAYDLLTYDVDATFTNDAEAFVNSNPRIVVEFDLETGEVDEDTRTGWDTATSTTTLVPFELKKREPSTEGELQRGVHDNKTVYTLEITNNSVNDSTNFSIVDYLPAGLEFLGCTSQDNTAGTDEEYTGSGRIDDTPLPAAVDCNGFVPTTSTVTVDPDGAGPLPNAVYTKVEWTSLGTIVAGATLTIKYAAAIPLRENEASALNATANLDNNTGPLTEEEQQLKNYAVATGTYGASVYTDDDTATVTAEDVAIQKSVDQPAIAQGGTSIWSLDFQSSEYALSTSNFTIVDTIPDGLDYKSSAPAADSAVTNADGTITLSWDFPGFVAASESRTITVTTEARTDYRNGGGPVSSNDSWTNSVTLVGTAEVITDSGANTSTLPVIDESSAGQTAQGVSINKRVAQPADIATTCGAESGLAFSETVTGPFHPGDLVCYELTVDFPGILDSLDVAVADFLPAGFTYEAFEYTSASTLTAADGIVFSNDAGSPLLSWNVGDVDASAEFQVLISARISDPAAITDGSITANIMKMTYENSAGDVFQLRDQADTLVEKPIVTVAKGITELNTNPISGAPVDTLTVQATDRVTYSITVTNDGSQAAENISIRDNLPALLECSDIPTGNISDGGLCSGGSIEWTVPGPVAAGDSYTVTYDVITPADSSLGDVFLNTTGVRNYEGDTNNGGPQVYVPENNIDPTLEDDANSDEATDTATASVERPTVVKTATTSIDEGGNNAASEATIGELITYTVTTTIPEGTSAFGDPAVTDIISDDLEIVGDPTFTVDGGLEQNATVNGQLVTAPLGATYVNAAGTGDDLIVLTIVVRVLDASGPVRSDVVSNNATFAWDHVDGSSDSGVSDSVTTTIVEPDISLQKSSNAVDGMVAAGDVIEYTLALRNSSASNVSTAHDTVIVDTLPDTVQPLNGTGDPVTADATLPGGGVWDQSERTITFTVASIAPGAGPDFTYSVEVVNPLRGGATIVNTADATTTSIAGEVPDERTSESALGTEEGGYQDSSIVTLQTPGVGVNKTATPETRTIGEAVTYTVDVTIPSGVLADDVTIIDTMPANVRFGAFNDDAVCDQDGSACSEEVDLIGAPSTSDRTIGFSIGDFDPAVAEDRVITFSYTGIVTTAATDGSTLVNTVRPYWNDENLVDGTPTTVPAPADFANDGTPSTANTQIVEPTLTIDKAVEDQTADSDTRRAKPGDALEYTVIVTNTGTAPAYDVTVTDTPDDRVTDFTSVDPAGVTNTDSDPSDGTLSWSIPGPIAVGDSVEITYTVTMPLLSGSDAVLTGAEIVNTADISGYFGVPAADRDPAIDYNEYDDVTADVVSIELDLASIGNYIWYDVNNDGVQDPTEPGLANVGVTVVGLGADGTFGTPDDKTYNTVTDSEGEYLVQSLPSGIYRVTVDAATLPAGMTASYDFDGTTVTPNGVWQGALAENGEERDVDFGYTGTGSIGDYIWFDQNSDGIQDSNEPGLPDATVTVVFGGQDGDLATTADNVTVTTTTDADGNYTVNNLPAGPYSVTVSDLPAGYAVVSDPNGGTSATSTTALTAGEDRTDQDFGYNGTASIGDYVWLDRNNDGVQDPTERGINGAQLQLTWFGNDGIEGNGDDGVFLTTTDALGAYSFTNLLPGDYSVEVLGGLPDGVVNSFDSDGNNNSQTPVSISVGDAVTSVDFGYFADSVIGDRVWWDRNSDGVQNVGEPGLGNVDISVTYFGADGVAGGTGTNTDVVYTAQTDADGDWIIINIPDGEYLVEVTAGIPSGFAQTYDDDAATEGLGGQSQTTLDASDLNQDFGYNGDSSISDLVWLDLNNDGVQDAGEPGLAGVDVTLVWFGADGVAGGGDDVTFVETTDDNGEYFFGGLPEGNYSVTVDTATLPAGLLPSFDADAGTNTPTPGTPASGVAANSTTAVSLPADTDLDTIDFGYAATGSLGDTVWLDQNSDGVVDADEVGIPEVGVTLTWAGLDGLLGTPDDVVFTTTTDASGNYLFEHLPTGTFTVELANLPAGVAATADPDGGADDASQLVLSAGEANLEQDFGYAGDAGVGDLLWLDVDNDGVQGANEPGLPGIVITITSPGTDGVFGTADDIVITATTDENGNYLEEGLPAGEVQVSYDPTTLPEGYVPSADLDGGDFFDTTATLVSGETLLDVDFIVIGSATLIGAVFDDADGDGVRDTGELGIPNATVDVVWAGPNGPVTITVVTDADGAWVLTNLPAGTYTATVDLSSVSSDYRPSTGTSSTVELPAFGSRSVIQGLTNLMLAFTGSNIALGGGLAVLLLLLGFALTRPRRRAGTATAPAVAALTTGK
ncbi:SdrD B-like domain-containing protein [Salinibacterium sp. SWN1162]|uniref:SdrD B-like domain-containing protein n=1 Tax=Salinibacterium sp. SWN1162 TaxID=2792053 RepID=UPI0018CFE8B0|nr:SdrD B-like domain-containing protein [Salinibacterium sp. SWN1162]MBH0008135.1 carboxypeptidase regulatory-like domain-containing protein [Salinibacterium sp. SWN1162]